MVIASLREFFSCLVGTGKEQPQNAMHTKLSSRKMGPEIEQNNAKELIGIPKKTWY